MWVICTDAFHKKNSFPITIKKFPMLRVTKKRDREGEDVSELSLKGCYFYFISEQNHPDDRVLRVFVCRVNERNVFVYTYVCTHLHYGGSFF